ncbi:MAG: ABC transporter ATP-binding protein [Verrucomicrobiales bacterium]|nr:ABC transporter ATP-binding protein [Verrucomicrobiales bacterium]
MSDQNSPAIEAIDVVRTFTIGTREIKVLKGVTLRVEKGEKLFLVGPSGAGKTSLLYTLAGLESPNEGEVRVDGKSLYQMKKNKQASLRNRLLGYVFQNFFLLPELTAVENVMLPSLISGKLARERAEALLERVGLSHRRSHLPTELSGGEQQRVAIARAMINSPTILFADEPTGNLDSKTGRAVMELFTEMVDEKGGTLLVVTHDSELAKTGNRQVLLTDGKIAA